MAPRIDMKSGANKNLPVVQSHGPVMHMFVAGHDFNIFWRGCTLHYQKDRRYAAEDSLKVTIAATDRSVIWES